MADPLFSPMLMGPPQRFGAVPTLPQPVVRPQAPMMQGGTPPGIVEWLQSNPGVVMQLAAGMMGGRQALPQALSNMPAAMKLDSEAARRKRQEAAARKWLESQKALSPDTAALLQEADPSDVISAATKAQFGGGDEYGLAPLWTQDDKGNWTPTQPSKSGKAPRPMQPPPGSRFVPPGDIAAAKASGHESGKGEGEALAEYRSMTSKLPGLESVVVKLDQLADKATYTMGGQAVDATRRQLGWEPREAAVARAEYIAMVDNQILPLLRDTFGAQFTVKEGESLRATLGQVDLSPQEKKAVLRSFIEQKKRDIEAKAQQAGIGQRQPATGGWSVKEVGR